MKNFSFVRQILGKTLKFLLKNNAQIPNFTNILICLTKFIEILDFYLVRHIFGTTLMFTLKYYAQSYNFNGFKPYVTHIIQTYQKFSQNLELSSMRHILEPH